VNLAHEDGQRLQILAVVAILDDSFYKDFARIRLFLLGQFRPYLLVNILREGQSVFIATFQNELQSLLTKVIESQLIQYDLVAHSQHIRCRDHIHEKFLHQHRRQSNYFNVHIIDHNKFSLAAITLS
jgi:hypothetical protein